MMVVNDFEINVSPLIPPNQRWKKVECEEELLV
jgi:hypothetical protein